MSYIWGLGVDWSGAPQPRISRAAQFVTRPSLRFKLGEAEGTPGGSCLFAAVITKAFLFLIGVTLSVHVLAVLLLS